MFSQQFQSVSFHDARFLMRRGEGKKVSLPTCQTPGWAAGLASWVRPVQPHWALCWLPRSTVADLKFSIVGVVNEGSHSFTFTGPHKFRSQSCWTVGVCSHNLLVSPGTSCPLPHLPRKRTWVSAWPKVSVQRQALSFPLPPRLPRR